MFLKIQRGKHNRGQIIEKMFLKLTHITQNHNGHIEVYDWLTIVFLLLFDWTSHMNEILASQLGWNLFKQTVYDTLQLWKRFLKTPTESVTLSNNLIRITNILNFKLGEYRFRFEAVKFPLLIHVITLVLHLPAGSNIKIVKEPGNRRHLGLRWHQFVTTLYSYLL